MLDAVPHRLPFPMLKRAFFVFRLVLAWMIVVAIAMGVLSTLPLLGWVDNLMPLLMMGTLLLVLAGAVTHLGRVQLIAGRSDGAALSNRQRRQIEIPLEAGEAFDLLDAAIRELPRIEHVESARDSLQVRATLGRPRLYGESAFDRYNPLRLLGAQRNSILATVTPGADSSSATLIFEPQNPSWSDAFLVDDGTNFENAEGVARAVSRRIAERRRGEQAQVAQTVTEKELATARLNLLHAQVEPHFLYNTLASAQLLTRSDPERAESMLGHLITYLRHSLPRDGEAPSTLGVELERALAYLEIMKVRMGARLAVQVDVPEPLRATPLPPMMLQVLVENAIKHGLEPRTAGGTVWIRARQHEDQVAVTVADDGNGLGTSTPGTGIGLANVRERLRLLFGARASLSVIANFPTGVAATLTVPAAEVRHA